MFFWKKHYWVATTTDCFEPIFGFLGQFCFEKHRSASWSRIGMFSELSGRSENTIFYHFQPKITCCGVLLSKMKDWFIILEQNLEIPAIVCLTHRKENDKKIRKLVLRPFEEGNWITEVVKAFLMLHLKYMLHRFQYFCSSAIPKMIGHVYQDSMPEFRDELARPQLGVHILKNSWKF